MQVTCHLRCTSDANQLGIKKQVSYDYFIDTCSHNVRDLYCPFGVDPFLSRVLRSALSLGVSADVAGTGVVGGACTSIVDSPGGGGVGVVTVSVLGGTCD